MFVILVMLAENSTPLNVDNVGNVVNVCNAGDVLNAGILPKPHTPECR